MNIDSFRLSTDLQYMKVIQEIDCPHDIEFLSVGSRKDRLLIWGESIGSDADINLKSFNFVVIHNEDLLDIYDNVIYLDAGKGNIGYEKDNLLYYTAIRTSKNNLAFIGSTKIKGIVFCVYKYIENVL